MTALLFAHMSRLVMKHTYPQVHPVEKRSIETVQIGGSIEGKQKRSKESGQCDTATCSERRNSALCKSSGFIYKRLDQRAAFTT
jgi:hypothetical protein